MPASNRRFLEKATTLNADGLVFDLEDSVANSEKVAARALLGRALADLNFGEATRSVRVNAWETKWTEVDIRSVLSYAGDRVDAIVLPKVASSRDVLALDELLTTLESELELAAGAIGIEAMIESAAGLVHINEIACASRRLDALVFGPLDFAASIGMANLDVGRTAGHIEDDAIASVRLGILVAARAAGVLAIDGPFVSLDDDQSLQRAAEAAARLGYDGKWCIHPTQIDTVNTAFSPNQAEFDRACSLLDRFHEAADREGSGAVRFEGAMIDEATRRLAIALVARGERAGLARAPRQST